MPIGKIERLDSSRLTIAADRSTTQVHGLRVYVGGLSVSVHRADARAKVAPRDRNDPAALARQMTLDLQELVDAPVMPVADLHDDEPAKAADPDTPGRFWVEIDGETWLVERTAIVEVLHDGTNFYLEQRSTLL